MASTSGRRAVPYRTAERQSIVRGDDPWCLICGVNLALDGRTFTVVSRHQNSELCDAFLRVLAMTFTQEHSSVNVCNRCERQLKRLGRTSSIAIARHEGQKFRDQVEKNLAKHGQAGIELGDFRNFNYPTSASANTRSVRDGAASSASSLQRGQSYDANASIRAARDAYGRSNSGVHFEDDSEARRRGAWNRNHSAPGRNVQKRELTSSYNEADKNQEGKRENRSSIYSTSVERTSSIRARSTDRKITSEIKSHTPVSTQQRSSSTRDKNRSIQKVNAVDVQKKSGKVATSKNSSDTSKQDNIKTQNESMKTPEGFDSPGAKIESTQIRDKGADSREFSQVTTNPFEADEQVARVVPSFDTDAAMNDDNVPVQSREYFDHSQKTNESLQTAESVQAADEPFVKPDRVFLKGSPRSSESSDEADFNSNKYGSNMPTDKRTDRETQDNEDHDHIGGDDGIIEPVADEERDRPKKPKVTFSDNVETDDTLDEPHTAKSPESPRSTSSEQAENNKGKLSKYESLDLDIDKTNPFFQDVYGEYNRRITLKNKSGNAGISQAKNRGFQKHDAIPETEVAEEIEESIMESERKKLFLDESAESQSNGIYERNSKSQEGTVTSGEGGKLEGKQNRTSPRHGVEDQKTSVAGEALWENTVAADKQQDSAPLISDIEENKEDTKENEALQTTDTVGPEESPDAGRGIDDANEDSPEEVAASGHDKKHPETQTGTSEAQKQEVENDIMISEVIQAAQLEQSVNFDHAHQSRSGGVSFVKDAADENDSQISPQPVPADVASGTKSEVSPLIDKDIESSDKKSGKGKVTKFKDQQPGFPCCTIL